MVNVKKAPLNYTPVRSTGVTRNMSSSDDVVMSDDSSHESDDATVMPPDSNGDKLSPDIKNIFVGSESAIDNLVTDSKSENTPEKVGKVKPNASPSVAVGSAGKSIADKLQEKIKLMNESDDEQDETPQESEPHNARVISRKTKLKFRSSESNSGSKVSDLNSQIKQSNSNDVIDSKTAEQLQSSLDEKHDSAKTAKETLSPDKKNYLDKLAKTIQSCKDQLGISGDVEENCLEDEDDEEVEEGVDENYYENKDEDEVDSNSNSKHDSCDSKVDDKQTKDSIESKKSADLEIKTELYSKKLDEVIDSDKENRETAEPENKKANSSFKASETAELKSTVLKLPISCSSKQSHMSTTSNYLENKELINEKNMEHNSKQTCEKGADATGLEQKQTIQTKSLVVNKDSEDSKESSIDDSEGKDIDLMMEVDTGNESDSDRLIMDIDDKNNSSRSITPTKERHRSARSITPTKEGHNSTRSISPLKDNHISTLSSVSPQHKKIKASKATKISPGSFSKNRNIQALKR